MPGEPEEMPITHPRITVRANRENILYAHEPALGQRKNMTSTEGFLADYILRTHGAEDMV